MCKLGKRVKVWSGDNEVYLGEGEFVGFADVYLLRMPDGSIMSAEYAEEKPEGGGVEDYVELVRGNPKIKLDSGRIVYGCQVWWRLVEGEENA